ncbi:MAG TPA: S53 family peptidase, partial [Pseudonocardiaceae bacterium]|nr:S53 family peptidase [Pseudonocardiaceae bacterium]
MKTLRILAAAVAPVPIFASLVLGGTANAASQLVALANNVNPALASSDRVATLAPDTPMSVAVSLKLHNTEGLNQFLADVANPASPTYRHYLTPAQFDARYGPTRSDVATVTSFLTASGLKVTHVEGQVVDATGSAATISHAFDTSIGTYKQANREYFANATAPTVPANVAAVVQGISGLDNHTVHTNDAVAKPAASVQGFTPSQLHTAYNTGSLGTGSGESVALWEFDGYQQSNISAYDKQFGISPSAPTTVSVDGANYNSNPGDGQGEVELDIEIVQGMASAVKTYVYEAPNSDQGQIDMANQIASDDKVQVTSISWGECETESSSATTTSTDNALEQGASEGISFYSASGDSGSDDCGDGSTAVDYPGSDPNVSSVGGTSLKTGSGGAYKSEVAWNSDGGASGGGVSTVFKAPSWQKGSGGMRTVPDISSDADPNTGFAVYSAGSWQEYGGTSCAAPMWAGFTALYNAQSGGQLGNPNPALYKV